MSDADTDDDNTNAGRPKRQGFIMREYTVFNAAQAEGIELPEPEELTPPNPPQDIDSIQQVLHNMDCPPELSWSHNQALYRPASDRIEMPDPRRFYDQQGLLETFWHELAHATGHPSRLSRHPDELRLQETNIHERAAEELVAEITAAMMMAHYDLPPEANPGNAAYIASWRRYLKQHPGHLITAAQRAQKAYDLIISALQTSDDTC